VHISRNVELHRRADEEERYEVLEASDVQRRLMLPYLSI